MDYCLSKDAYKFCPDSPSYNKPELLEKGLSEWDFVIITSSNEGQASYYRKQIEYRLSESLLPKMTRYIVVPDIEGKRIGSGGAIFNVLKQIYESSDDMDNFCDKHILVINSGGDSKRIPQYSASGKLFAPVARELLPGKTATLFDEIYKSVAKVPSRAASGILVLSGDILISFDPCQIDLMNCEAAAFSVSERAETGVNHGVFVPDNRGQVKEFLHKLPLQDLLDHGAVDVEGNVCLDTGAIWLNGELVQALYGLITTDGVVDDDKFNMFASEKARVSFYADFVYPLAEESTLDRYYLEKPEGEYSAELFKYRTVLWETLHRYRMKLISLFPALFIHFGTTVELLKMKTLDLSKYSHLGWSDIVLSTIATPGKISANSSFVDKYSCIGNGCYIENSVICNSKIGENCIISNTVVESMTVPDGVVISCQKQTDGEYVVRIYGVEDNPKQGYDNMGTFLGKPFKQFMKANKLTVADLWESKPYDLWTAKLFYKTAVPFKSLKHALFLSNSLQIDFKTKERISLKQSVENADFREIWLTQPLDCPR